MILVTGGAGYIGSVLTQELIRRKYQVRIFDSFIFGAKSIEQFKNKIDIVKGDIRLPPKGIFKDVDCVIHLAGLSNDPTADFDPQANFEINTQATINLALLAKKNKVKRFIFSSSCSIYDQGLKSKSYLQNESAKVNPTASYSRSKYLAEKQILPLADDQFTVIVVRKGTVFGYSPRMRYDLVVNTMIKDILKKGRIKILAGGKQWRPLISIEDVCDGYLTLIKAPETKVNGQIFNLLADNYKIINLAKVVKKVLQADFPVELGVDNKIVESRSYKVSNTKIQKKLGFSPKVTIEEAVSKIVKMIKKNHLDDFDNPNYYNIDWMKLSRTKKSK